MELGRASSPLAAAPERSIATAAKVSARPAARGKPDGETFNMAHLLMIRISPG
jgi:hypothetical protein